MRVIMEVGFIMIFSKQTLSKTYTQQNWNLVENNKKEKKC
jgi:hypothetical protein